MPDSSYSRTLRDRYRFLYAILIVVVAFLILAGVGVYAILDSQSNNIRDAQVRACEKIGNPRAQQITKNGEVLGQLLVTAEAARLASAKVQDGAQRRIDLAAARKYRALGRKLAPAPVVNCELLYPKP